MDKVNEEAQGNENISPFCGLRFKKIYENENFLLYVPLKEEIFAQQGLNLHNIHFGTRCECTG